MRCSVYNKIFTPCPSVRSFPFPCFFNVCHCCFYYRAGSHGGQRADTVPSRQTTMLVTSDKRTAFVWFSLKPGNSNGLIAQWVWQMDVKCVWLSCLLPTVSVSLLARVYNSKVFQRPELKQTFDNEDARNCCFWTKLYILFPSEELLRAEREAFVSSTALFHALFLS